MKTVMKKRFVPAYFRRDLHQSLKSSSHISRSVKEAPLMEQPKRRRHPNQGPLETPSKLHIIKDKKSGVKPREGHQTVASNRGDQEKSPIMPMMTKNVENFRMKDGEPKHEREDPTNGLKGDIRPINQAYQQIQKELSHDSTYSRNLTHKEITEKKNQLKISPNEEDMQHRSWQTCKGPEREQRLFNEVLRSNQDEPSCKSTYFGNLTHHRFTPNWNHLKIPHGLKVIQLLNQEMPGLPYLQANGFTHLQTRLWRPGEEYNHSGGIYKHPGGYFNILEGSDLRTNPFKGGGDGVIQERLYVSNTKQNSEKEQPEEEREITAGLGALDKANGTKMELSKARAHAWARRKKPRSVKPKHPGKHLKPKRKRLWVYWKAHISIGSKEESKALEARPPDGKSFTHGPKPNQKPS